MCCTSLRPVLCNKTCLSAWTQPRLQSLVSCASPRSTAQELFAFLDTTKAAMIGVLYNPYGRRAPILYIIDKTADPTVASQNAKQDVYGSGPEHSHECFCHVAT